LKPSWLPLPAELLPVLEVLAILSIAMVVVGIFLVPVFVARIPARYYVDPPSGDPEERRPRTAARLALLIGRNALGWVLAVAGVAMLALPGQGLLCLIAGLWLVDFPGKRKVEIWLLRRGPVLASMNWLRRRAGKEPLELP
jgi:hypothetical protein